MTEPKPTTGGMPPEDLSQQVTAAEAAPLLGVKPAAIYMWRQRRLITPVSYRAGRGHGGVVAEYDLEELRRVAEQTATTRRRQT